MREKWVCNTFNTYAVVVEKKGRDYKTLFHKVKGTIKDNTAING